MSSSVSTRQVEDSNFKHTPGKYIFCSRRRLVCVFESDRYARRCLRAIAGNSARLSGERRHSSSRNRTEADGMVAVEVRRCSWEGRRQEHRSGASSSRDEFSEQGSMFDVSYYGDRLKSASCRISRSPLVVVPSEDARDPRRYALGRSTLLGAPTTQAHHDVAASRRGYGRYRGGKDRALGNEAAAAGRQPHRNEGIRPGAKRSRTYKSSGELHGCIGSAVHWRSERGDLDRATEVSRGKKRW